MKHQTQALVQTVYLTKNRILSSFSKEVHTVDTFFFSLKVEEGKKAKNHFIQKTAVQCELWEIKLKSAPLVIRIFLATQLC